MKIKYLIDNILSPTISALDWVGRYGGVVQTINYQVTNSDPSKANPIKRYPIACDVQGKDCANLSALQSLSPDDSKLSVVYWEEISPMTDRGTTKTGNFFFRKFEGTARIVVWMNLRKLGKTSCGSPIEAMSELEEIIINRKSKIVGGALDGSFFEMLPARGVKKDIQTIFGKYDYNKLIPYYLPPFDYFAIDVSFKLEQCLAKETIFVPSTPVDCENVVDSFINEYSFNFRGSQYIDCTNDNVFNFSHSDPHTMFAYCKSTNWASTGMICGKRSATDMGYNMFSNAGKLRVVLRGGATSNAIIVETVDTLTDNQWYLLGYSYDGSGNASGLKIYVDGLPVAMNIIQNLVFSTLSNTNPFQIGCSNGAFCWNGKIDEVRVWNKLIDDTQWSLMYNGGTPIAPLDSDDLVVYSRQGDGATWNGASWEIPDDSNNILGGYTSISMIEADRSTDIP